MKSKVDLNLDPTISYLLSIMFSMPVKAMERSEHYR
jgi:hypothetical protein